MINLDNIQFVLFDFDDTLCIHLDHTDTLEGEARYNNNILEFGHLTFAHCTVNRQMKQFIDICKDKNIRMGLISTTLSFKHMQAKNDWVFFNYGVNLENFCVGTFEGKLQIMQAISDTYKIPKDAILIVDDFWENLGRAANAGFQTCTPMEVVNYINIIDDFNADIEIETDLYACLDWDGDEYEEE